MVRKTKIAFGGGCHWCTEAVFQSLIGVEKVAQGFVASDAENDVFSEAVIVHFDPNKITLKILTEIHLHTHKSTSNHTMRKKYRSAIYFFDNNQKTILQNIIKVLQPDFKDKIITQILKFKKFKPSEEMFKNYFYSNPKKPFCETFINPKLTLLLSKYKAFTNTKKLNKIFS